MARNKVSPKATATIKRLRRGWKVIEVWEMGDAIVQTQAGGWDVRFHITRDGRIIWSSIGRVTK